MYITFGVEKWESLYRELLSRYEIYDDNVERPGVYMYVRLVDGSKYLTKRSFNSADLSSYKPSTFRYLCVYVGTCNVTHIVKKFASSWNALEIKAIDFILLCSQFDKKVNNYIMNCSDLSQKVVLVDDDTFDEKEYSHFDSLPL